MKQLLGLDVDDDIWFLVPSIEGKNYRTLCSWNMLDYWTNFSRMQTNGIISQGLVFFPICKSLSLDVLAW